MHILLTDETNQQESKTSLFFIYGGIFFPIEHLNTLDSEIEKIRTWAGYNPEDVFKFDTRSRPSQVSIDKATEAKRKVLDLCLKLECKFIAHIILHKIILNQKFEQQLRWAADYVIGRFNKYLREIGDTGICVIDNLPEKKEFQYLSEKFIQGLNFPDGSRIDLDRIQLYASTCIGASHANSAMDIVLGSFRFCVNNPINVKAAEEMFTKVCKMMWHKNIDNTLYIRDKGLIVRPKVEDIQIADYKKEYENLLVRLRTLFKG